MVRKRSGALLKRELDNLSFLQSHPEVQRHFSNVGCMEFVESYKLGATRPQLKPLPRLSMAIKLASGPWKSKWMRLSLPQL
jgi:hypothetical protein